MDKRFPEDKGALWENFIISERIKRGFIEEYYGQYWFWRTASQAEVDLLEEIDGGLSAYEFKYNPMAKARLSPAFKNAYPDTPFQVVAPANLDDFLLD